MPKRVAVTGAHGFIGRAVCAELARRKYVPVELDRHNGNDILTTNLIEPFDRCRAVIHLAGLLGTSELFDQIDQAIETNIVGTHKVLEACVKTDTEYVGIAVPDCWPSVYQATKLAAVRLAEAVENNAGLPVRHVRAFNAYGPGQAHGPGHPQKIVPTFAWHSWRGKPMPIWGDGDQTVDLVHVDHVAECLVRAATDPHVPHGTFDAATGEERTVLEVAQMVGSITGQAAMEHLPMRAGELPHTDIRVSYSKVFGYDRFDYHKFQSAVLCYR